MQPGTDKLRADGHGADGHGTNGHGRAGEAAVEAPNWRTYAGKRVTVHAPEGSYAARRAPGELREADRAFDALEKLLDPPDSKRGSVPRVDVYLADPVFVLPAASAAGENGAGEAVLENVGSDAIVRV